MLSNDNHIYKYNKSIERNVIILELINFYCYFNLIIN